MRADARDRATAIVTGLEGESDSTPASAEQLFTLVYDELRRLAHAFMQRETPGHTLQPTALVHEAYLALVDGSRVGWQGRAHFFAVGARVMRRLLIDHARARGRVKRGGDRRRVTLSEAHTLFDDGGLEMEQLLTLHAALDRLAGQDERAAQVVELRFFAGLTVPEVAEVLRVSARTVEGDWTHARAWLCRELARKGGS